MVAGQGAGRTDNAIGLLQTVKRYIEFEMTQQVKVISAKSDNLGSILGTNMVKGEN